jgi:cell division protein FtsL
VNIHQRLHQEQDPRARRTFIAVLLVCATLVGGALGVVGLRVQQVHLAYQLDRLRSERQQIETSIRQLEVEVATLQSPSRVEQRARQLGLVTPGRRPPQPRRRGPRRRGEDPDPVTRTSERT